MMELYHYTGAGNNFLIADGRGRDCSMLEDAVSIVELCKEYKTDGLMVMESSNEYDFKMLFFNPDGSGGMMCGNGGRCIVAFAKDMGVIGDTCTFLAPDGVHKAEILEDDGVLKTVRLKMVDVHGLDEHSDGIFLNTGTRHFVCRVADIDAVDVEGVGAAIRHRPVFAPEGTNVNFVEPRDGRLYVRTFEKGVEGETLACGTGIVASAIAACNGGVTPSSEEGIRVSYDVIARRGDKLAVDFVPSGDFNGFTASSVYLTGPAEKLGTFNVTL